MKPKVAPYKKKVVEQFVKYFKEYPLVGVVDMESLPAKQLQNIREALRGKVELVMTKKRFIKIAIEQVKDDKKGIENLLDYMKGMPALLFTKEDPFLLAKTIRKNMSRAPIKAGQVAPDDIIIKAGPTPFAPGPIIGELGQMRVKATIEGGKVVISKDSVVAKEGDVVDMKLANILSRLGEEPMRIGLNLVAVYDKGDILTKDVLFVDEQEYLDKIALASSWAMNLAVEAGFPTEDTVKIFLSKANAQAQALSKEANIMTSDNVGELLAKAESEASAIKKKTDA